MKDTELNLIMTVLEDSFHAPSSIMCFNDQTSDDFDGGIRHLLWGDYTVEDRVSSLLLNIEEHKILVFKSVLGFYNVSVSLELGENPPFLSIGPLAAEPYTTSMVQNLLKDIQFPSQKMDAIYSFYSHLPVASGEDVTALVRHLFAHFDPTYEKAEVRFVDFNESTNEITLTEERLFDYNTHSAERIQALILSFVATIDAADTNRATEITRTIIHSTMNTGTSMLTEARRIVHGMNTLILSHLLASSIHPYYVIRQFSQMDAQIAKATSMDELISTALTLTHKSCLLVKNYSFPEYSYLVRHAINYIDQHLDQDLSLSILAKEVGKNASYLSAQFNREVGISLTEYIHKTRIRESLKYLTTSELPIADIAELVGFADVGYYTRVFKKQIGNTPSEYRKMLQ